MLNEHQFYLLDQIQTCQTGGQAYSNTFPNNREIGVLKGFPLQTWEFSEWIEKRLTKNVTDIDIYLLQQAKVSSVVACTTYRHSVYSIIVYTLSLRIHIVIASSKNL